MKHSAASAAAAALRNGTVVGSDRPLVPLGQPLGRPAVAPRPASTPKPPAAAPEPLAAAPEQVILLEELHSAVHASPARDPAPAGKPPPPKHTGKWTPGGPGRPPLASRAAATCPPMYAPRPPVVTKMSEGKVEELQDWVTQIRLRNKQKLEERNAAVLPVSGAAAAAVAGAISMPNPTEPLSAPDSAEESSGGPSMAHVSKLPSIVDSDAKAEETAAAAAAAAANDDDANDDDAAPTLMATDDQLCADPAT